MSLFRSIKVDMPTEKITFKKGKNDNIYVYYTVRSYRREKDNKPTSDEVIIGKKDNETGMLIPNNKYYELFNVDENIMYNPISVQIFGTFYFLDAIAKKINLYDDLYSVFNDKTKYILTLAFYMLTRGNTMKYIDYWCEENYNYLSIPLVSQRVSEIFADISFDDRMTFFKKWSKHIKESEYIAYDVTSISSYSKQIDNVSYGYNRDGEKLPQINLGMYTGEKSKLPIFYNVYNGSINDKEQLIFMIKHTKELNIKNIKFVMDKGFYKGSNLDYMYDNNYPFIICLSNSLLNTKEYIKKVSDTIQSASNWNNKHQVYATSMEYIENEKIYNIHIIFNPDKQVDEQKITYSEIEKYMKELDTYKEEKKVPQSITKYEKYFDVAIKRKRIEYKLSNEKVKDEMQTNGYVLFLTSDLKVKPIEALEIYRNKDVIEKNFNNLKNELDFSRIKTHLNDTTEGKIFVGFIALILRSYILNSLDKVKETLKKTNITVKEILLELEKIKVTKFIGEKTTLMAITKTQKSILNTYDISYDINKALESI